MPKLSAARLSKPAITPKTSASLSFTSATATSVTLTATRQFRGRRNRAGQCVKMARTNANGRPCTYALTVGTKTLAAAVGGNVVTLKTSTFAGRVLAAGAYTIALSVRSGNTVKVTLIVRAR